MLRRRKKGLSASPFFFWPAVLVVTACSAARPAAALTPPRLPPPAVAPPNAPAERAEAVPESEGELATAAPAAPADEDRSKPSATDRGLVVPDLEYFFPEGEFDLRLNRLIDKVFFEGQVRYDFVDGDITAFMRYRYYGFRRTYQLSVFDAIEFDDVESFDDEFERIRGVLWLTQWPHSFHRRSFLAAEVDGISSNKEELQSNDGQTNWFLRFGYQVGTPNDSRSNAIVGERRAQVERLFTPYRAIGPGDAGFTGAVTWGFEELGGDFEYLKVEVEALKRFELPKETFLIGRLHAGTFPHKPPIEGAPPDAQVSERYRIPRNELFRLDGRNNLKGLDTKDRGTEEVHTTWELLVPWFTDEERRFLKLDWRTWYWTIYAGYGNLGTTSDTFSELSEYSKDVGLGFQSSFEVRGYRFFLSALAAQELRAGAGTKVRVSFKSYH